MNPSDLDIFRLISGAGIVVQFILFLLLFFSVTSWTIIIIKYRHLNKALKESHEFTDFFWSSRNLAEAFAKAKQMEYSPVARVYRIGYIELKKLSRSVAANNTGDQPATAEAASLGAQLSGLDNVKRALRRATGTELNRLTQMVPFLATTGNTAPFIGLFGTVWGIMNSFRGIANMKSVSIANVAPGISEALIATAAGLAAAIPAVIAFNYFTSRINNLDSELESFASDFLNIIELDKLRDRRPKA